MVSVTFVTGCYKHIGIHSRVPYYSVNTGMCILIVNLSLCHNKSWE